MKKSYIIGLWALVLLIVHLMTAKNYEFHRDELLYMSLGKHLDWGFASVPPFIGFLAKIASLSFDNDQLGIKLMAALGGSATLIFVGLIAVQLGGNRLAVFVSCAAFALSSSYLWSTSLFQPVIFDIFFWTLSAYFFIKLIQRQDPSVWLPLFACWGFGFLNKYNIAFMALGGLMAILFSPTRRLFLSKYFLWSILLGLIIVLPNLIWQYQHGMPVLYHMRELRENQLVHVSLVNFLFDQLLMNVHAVALWLFALIVVLFYKNEKDLRPIGLGFIITFVLFALLNAKSYYTLGMYPMLFGIGGWAIEKYWKRAYQVVLIGMMFILPFPLIPMALFAFPPAQMEDYLQKAKPIIGDSFLRWEGGEMHTLPQDHADMTGWQELADLVGQAYQSLSDEEKQHCAIFCENYGQAAAVLILGKNLPHPFSFSDNFLYWMPDSLSISTLIYVNDETENIRQLFNRVDEVGKVQNPYFRETQLPVFICREPTQFIPFVNDKIKTIKANRRGF